MTRVAYVSCSAGVAGDMLLGALVDAGADPDAVVATLSGLGRLGADLVQFESVDRGGVAATHAVVTPEADHEHRPVRTILELLSMAELAEPVRGKAERVFTLLAETEGAVHGIEPGDVELHEVGAMDAIVDIVGVAAALESLGIERIVASPVAMGTGSIETAHGTLPNPPPAVTRLAAARDVPVVGVDTTMELATPTGMAILVALADEFGPLPPMHVTAVGWGAGSADPPGRANVVQVLIGEAAAGSTTPRPGQAAIELEANVDDVTGEVLAHTIMALMAAGARDAWATPIVMKKGRPAHTVHALGDPHDLDRLAAVLLAETGSLGVRASVVERWPQPRELRTVEVDGHQIRLKVAGGRVKPEHDDAVAAAKALGRPLRDVLHAAEAAFRP